MTDFAQTPPRHDEKATPANLRIPATAGLDGGPKHGPRTISAEDARQGRTPGIVRYVLAIGLVAAVLALAAVMLAAV